MAKYARYGTESTIKTYEKSLELNKQKLKEELAKDKNSWEVTRLRKKIKTTTGQLRNLRYVLKRMGKKDEIELPSSVLPRPEQEYVIASRS